MPKAPNKSSASKATLKKQAAKKAAKEGDDFSAGPSLKKSSTKGLSKAEKKALKAQPKVYVPPPKPPAAALPDPLDAQGLARTLPAELVVVLRRLGKKDAITRRKGLDELRLEWIEPIKKRNAAGKMVEGSEEDQDLYKLDALVEALPVWLHHLPSLLLSPPHRSIALQIHNDLLSVLSIRSSIINSLNLGLLVGPHQIRDVLGSWLVAALEDGRRGAGSIGSEGIAIWDQLADWTSPAQSDARIDMLSQMELLVEYLSLAILSPRQLHDEIHPPQPQASAPGSGIGTPKKGLQSTAAVIPTFVRAGEVGPDDVAEEDTRMDEVILRYRHAGISGLTYLIQSMPPSLDLPESVQKLLHETEMWNLIRPPASSEVTSTLAPNAPIRRALYMLLRCLITKREAWTNAHLVDLIGPLLLQSAWLEEDGAVWSGGIMGEALALFLTKFRRVWSTQATSSLEPTQEEDGTEDEHSSSEDADDDDVEDDADVLPEAFETPAEIMAIAPGLQAYKLFLGFLQRGCNGQAVEAYPLVLVIISTIPEDILPLTTEAFSTLFTSFWAPPHARLLSHQGTPGSVSPFHAFVSAMVDSVVYLAARAWRATISTGEATESDISKQQSAKEIARDEFSQLWKEGVLGTASKSNRSQSAVVMDCREQAHIIGKGLARLMAISPELTSESMSMIEESTLGYTFPNGTTMDKGLSHAVLPILRSLQKGQIEASPIRSLVSNVSTQLGESSVRHLSSSIMTHTGPDSSPESDAAVDLLVSLLSSPTESQAARQHLFSTIGQVVSTREAISALSPSRMGALVSAYLRHTSDLSASAATWISLSRALATHGSDRSLLAAQAILDQSDLSLLAISSAKDAWDDLAMAAAEDACGLHTCNASSAFLEKVIVNSDTLISKDTVMAIRTLISGALYAQAQSVLQDETGNLSEIQAIALVDLLEHEQSGLAELAESPLHQQAFFAFFDFAFTLPSIRPFEAQWPALFAKTQLSWKNGVQRLPTSGRTAVINVALSRLQEMTNDLDCTINPSDIVGIAATFLAALGESNPSVAILTKVTPDIASLHQQLDALGRIYTPVELAVLDSLVPQSHAQSGSRPIGHFDKQGRSVVARGLESLLTVFSLDRMLLTQFAESHFPLCSWAWYAAADETAVLGGSRGIYKQDIDLEYLTAVQVEADHLMSYWAVTAARSLPSSWHMTATSTLLKTGSAKDPVLALLQNIALDQQSEGSLSARMLRDMLVKILRATDPDGAALERWLGLAQNIYDSNLEVALAVLLALRELRFESPRLQRLQNEVASKLSGVNVEKVNTEGLKLLRLLNALAPPRDSTSDFIPQQRVVFLMKNVNNWLVNDEIETDLPEDLEARIVELYEHLCPVVQDVQGAHWHSIFDLIANNLEASSLSDASTYSLCYHTLDLVSRLTELVKTNKSLKAEWKERKQAMQLILDLLLEMEPNHDRNEPLNIIESMIVDLLESTDLAIVDVNQASQLYRLLSFSPMPIQRLVYRLLDQVIDEEIPRLVVEVESTSTDLDHVHSLPKLSADLVALITQKPFMDLEEGGLADDATRGYIIAWMLVFQHFEQASSTLRASYIEQIRNGLFLSDGLVPTILQSLRIASSTERTADLSRFAVDEFFLSTLDEMDLESTQALLAHLFYRALVNVPALVRQWYEACKDRQLAMSFSSAVTKYLSPVLIGHEFALLRNPEALQQLQDENLTIKVSSGAAEVTASYVIDEQPMEIGVRLPPDFPLRSVEVKDLKRVGVPENKWRGWLLNIQQTITSRNGLILEALTLFKKNVSLHFEGVVECAICYSIISMQDRTLPSKPCRTCKNRFHASCLYKWFNSSNSSTCPMCRSLF